MHRIHVKQTKKKQLNIVRIKFPTMAQTLPALFLLVILSPPQITGRGASPGGSGTLPGGIHAGSPRPPILEILAFALGMAAAAGLAFCGCVCVYRAIRDRCSGYEVEEREEEDVRLQSST